MNPSKFFLSTLIAAAAMTAPAYATDYTIGTSNNNDSTLTSATSEDTITFEKESGYLTAGGGTVNANVVINSLKLTDGYSGVTYTFNGTVTGSGEFSFNPTTGANNQNYVFNGDVSGYSGNMIINANKYGSFTFNNNATGTGAITATSAWCAVNFNGATINNSEVNAATINISGKTSFVANTSLIGKVVVASGAEASNTGTLNLSDAKVSLNGVALVNTGTVSVGSKTIFDLTSVDGAQTLISGGTITGWNTLGVSNFTVNGNVLAGRSSVELSNAGQVSITEVVATLVWNGGEQGTWDVESSENWLNNGQADKFYMLDGVEFTDSTTNGTIGVASAVTVTDFTVSSGIHTLTCSNGGYVAIAGSGTVENGATLILGTETGATGLLRGAITVKNGGTLQFNAKDVTGYNGGANSLQTITVDEGGSLIMNVDGNETFAGTLNLGGTIAKGDKAGSETAWDIWGNSSINVKSATAKIATNIRIGRQNAVITLDDGSMLTVSGNIVLRDSGSDTLKVDGGNGSGSFVFTGTSGTIGSGVKLGNGALTVGDGENASFLTVGRIEIGDNGSGNGESNSAVSRLNIEKNSTLKVTGATNTWSSTNDYKQNSVVLGEWSNTTHASIKGTLLAKDAEIGMGDWGAHIAVDGLLVAKGLGQAVKSEGDFVVTLNDGGKILVGESGISDKRSAQGAITLNAGTVGTYSDTTTLALGMKLNSGDGTTFDTQKYVFAEDGNSVSQGSDGSEISVTGILSGTGKLIKTGAGTLTLSGDNSYSGGTTISAGTLVAANANALGAGAVTISGGQLEVSEGVTVSNSLKVVLTPTGHGDLTTGYEVGSGKATIIGSGKIATGTSLEVCVDTELLTMIWTEGLTKQYQIFESSSLLDGEVTVSYTCDAAADEGFWNAFYNAGGVLSLDRSSGVLTLGIPEPSAFGLLAGAGALALVVSRRKRRK